MKKVLNLSVALIFAGLLITSCEKSDTEPALPEARNNPTTFSPILTVESTAVIAQAIESYLQMAPASRSAEFIPPFFMSGGFFILKDLVFDFSGPFPVIVGGELAGFSTDLDDNDFYRLNPDSTISVHVNSNNAFGEHMNLGTGAYSYGDKGHMAMNYTGDLIEFSFPGPDGELIVIRFIDTFSNRNAVVYQGNGKVQTDGTGPRMNLSAWLTANPGWTQAKIGFILK